MKKTLFLIVVVLATVCIFSAASLAEENTVTFYYDNDVEVTAELNEELGYERIKSIADRIAAGEISDGEPEEPTRLNPQCAAGNHALTYTTFSSVRHYVYTTSPKCVKDTYRNETCTRIGCSYSVDVLTGSERIYCH